MALTLSLHEKNAIEAIRKSNAAPAEVVLVTDAGRDHDDELAFIVLRGLERLGLAKLNAAIVNLSTDTRRARLVKGALNALQFSDEIPVAVGANDNPFYTPEAYEFDTSYMAAENDIQKDGQALLKHRFEDAVARGKKLTLVLISGMADARDFIGDNPELAKKAIGKVNIMGGVRVSDDQLLLDGHGHFLPDAAYNNAVDNHLNADPQTDPVGPSAKALYSMLQELHIPTEVVTRNIAYASAVHPSFYQDLASSGHPVAQRLMRDQQVAIEHLWENVQKGALGPRLTKDWFCQTFSSDTEKAAQQLNADPANPWAVVTQLNLYDPVSMIAAIVPDEVGLLSADMHGQHRIIGMSMQKTGIIDAEKMRATLSALAKVGLGAEINVKKSHLPADHAPRDAKSLKGRGPGNTTRIEPNY